MTPPQIPTDNFYKFFAISGVAIVIACIFNLAALTRLVGHQETETKIAKGVFEAEMAASKHRSTGQRADIEREVAMLEEMVPLARTSKGVLADLERGLEEVLELTKKTGDQWNADYKALVLREAEVSGHALRAERYAQDAKSFLWIFPSLLGMGLWMASYGFFFWYVRLQRYQDQQLRKSLDPSHIVRLGDEALERYVAILIPSAVACVVIGLYIGIGFGIAAVPVLLLPPLAMWLMRLRAHGTPAS